tara:strand:- start:247 stop:1449 length:1203 start_codon:yes stop_codon:yes gene_type:complete
MHAYFFIGIALSGLFFFFAAKRSQKKIPNQSGKWSVILLTFSFLIWATGLLEGVLLIPRKSSKLPPAPELLSSYKANPYILIKNSILYVIPPKNTFRTFGHSFITNQLGFRERNFEFKKPKENYRILVFGASLTFGSGIDLDHRYSNLLENMLKKKFPSKNVEILNFGMAAYNYDQEHDLMKALLKFITCDQVVIGVPGDGLQMTTQKNLTPITSMGKIKRKDLDAVLAEVVKMFSNPNRNLMTIPLSEPSDFRSNISWYKKLRLFKVIESRTLINSNQLVPNPSRLNHAVNEWRGIIKLLKDKNLPPPIAVLLYRGSVNPRKNNYINPTGDLAKNIRLLKFLGGKLKQEGFHVVDPLPLFKQHSGMSMAISEWEGHPNYLGHYIYAKTLFDSLIYNDWI